MPNFAIIENNKVINTVVAEEEYATEQGWVLLPNNVCIGWDYVDGQFVDNRPVTEDIPPVTPTKEELLMQLQTIQAQLQAL